MVQGAVNQGNDSQRFDDKRPNLVSEANECHLNESYSLIALLSRKALAGQDFEYMISYNSSTLRQLDAKSEKVMNIYAKNSLLINHSRFI